MAKLGGAKPRPSARDARRVWLRPCLAVWPCGHLAIWAFGDLATRRLPAAVAALLWPAARWAAWEDLRAVLVAGRSAGMCGGEAEVRRCGGLRGVVGVCGSGRADAPHWNKTGNDREVATGRFGTRPRPDNPRPEQPLAPAFPSPPHGDAQRSILSSHWPPEHAAPIGQPASPVPLSGIGEALKE